MEQRTLRKIQVTGIETVGIIGLYTFYHKNKGTFLHKQYIINQSNSLSDVSTMLKNL